MSKLVPHLAAHAQVHRSGERARSYNQARDAGLPRYCAAMRVSTQKQTDRYHTEQQWQEICVFLSHQHADGYVMVARIDETRSAAATDLSKLFELINVAASAKAKVVVSKGDRLFRSVENEARITRFMRQRGVTLVYADGIPALLRPLMNTFAVIERDLIRDRTRRIMASRRSDHRFSYKELNRAAISAADRYRGVHTVRVRAQQRRALVAPDVMRLRLDGLSIRDIVKRLRNREGEPVTKRLVERILKEHAASGAAVLPLLSASDDLRQLYGAQVAALQARLEDGEAERRRRGLIRVGYSLIHYPGEQQSKAVGPADTPAELAAEAKEAYESWLKGLCDAFREGTTGTPVCVDLVSPRLLAEAGATPDEVADWSTRLAKRSGAQRVE